MSNKKAPSYHKALAKNIGANTKYLFLSQMNKCYVTANRLKERP